VIFSARTHDLALDEGPLLVGVINATPDSFSDQGERSTAACISRAERLVADGASILEIGGESNISNADAVAATEELRRIRPVIEGARELGVPLAADTHKPEVAEAAIDAGVSIVNDIGGLRAPGMVELCARTGVGVVLVHADVAPKTVRWDDGRFPGGPTAEVVAYMRQRVAELVDAGIRETSIVVDPGPDIGKTPAQTAELLRNLDQVVGLGYPTMLAASRKDFIGVITSRRPSERLPGSLAAVAAGVLAGAKLIRTHDVAEVRDFLAVWSVLRGEATLDPASQIDDAIRRETPAGEYSA